MAVLRKCRAIIEDGSGQFKGQGGGAPSETIEYVWVAQHIDEIVARLVTDLAGASFEIYYHLTDHQFSTVALIDNAAKLIERVTYDAYGMARHHWPGDVNGDGAVGDADADAMRLSFNESIGDVDYNVDADITRTGRVTMDDSQFTSTGNYAAALPKGDLSSPFVGNVIGYCGYVLNPEVPTTGGGGGLYTVRFRHYDAELGRWLERDPLGYVDGMNLYGYAFGSPVHFSDPFGLSSSEDKDDAEAQEDEEEELSLWERFKRWLIGEPGEGGPGLSRRRQIESAMGENPEAYGKHDPLNQFYEDQMEAERWARWALHGMIDHVATGAAEIALVVIGGPVGRVIETVVTRVGSRMAHVAVRGARHRKAVVEGAVLITVIIVAKTVEVTTKGIVKVVRHPYLRHLVQQGGAFGLG